MTHRFINALVGALSVSSLTATTVWSQPLGHSGCSDIDAEVERVVAARESAAPGAEHATDVLAEQALTALETRCPSSWAELQLALVEIALERWSSAWPYMEDALGSEDPRVERIRGALLSGPAAELRRHVALVHPRVNAPDVSFFVGGVRVEPSRLSHSLAVAPGSVLLEVAARGYVTQRWRHELVAGEEVTHEFTLEPVVPREVREPPSATRRDPSVTRRNAGFTLLGLGAVVGLVGGAFGLLSLGTAREIAATCSEPTPSAEQRSLCAASVPLGQRVIEDWHTACDATQRGSQGEALCARHRAFSAAGIAAGIGSAALLTAGLVLVWTASHERPRPVTVSAWIHARDAGLTVQGTF